MIISSICYMLVNETKESHRMKITLHNAVLKYSMINTKQL